MSSAQQGHVATPGSGRGPSAPWFGGLASALAIGSFAWWLVWSWGVAFGGLGPWNYLISLSLIALAAVTMRWWRGA